MAQRVERWTCDQQVLGSNPTGPKLRNKLGQVVHTYVPPSPSREVEFYWHKQRYRVFVPPFGGLRGNVHGSSMARWKARGRLPIGDN